MNENDTDSGGISRAEARGLLKSIRNTERKLEFEDGVGDGWIKHESGETWRVRMSMGHVATMGTDGLMDELVAEAETAFVREGEPDD